MKHLRQRRSDSLPTSSIFVLRVRSRLRNRSYHALLRWANSRCQTHTCAGTWIEGSTSSEVSHVQEHMAKSRDAMRKLHNQRSHEERDYVHDSRAEQEKAVVGRWTDPSADPTRGVGRLRALARGCQNALTSYAWGSTTGRTEKAMGSGSRGSSGDRRHTSSWA